MPTASATPPAPARATVVVCTHNRAPLLATCLHSLAAQTVPASDFEIVVVDDGSTDTTPDVCARFAHLPNLRIIRQANAGLGAARERGWRAGTGRVVAFLDDDAEAPPGWLARILTHFETHAAPAACLGGPARGRWEAPRPPWLDDNLARWLTVWAPHDEPRESADEHLFVGANMSFLRSALDQVGGFDPALGRRGASLLSHEESELWERLRAAGHRAAYDPDLWVWHHVPASRARASWFRRRLFWEGRSLKRRALGPGARPRPWAALRVAVAAFFSRPVLAHFARPSRWGRSFAAQAHLSYKLGEARELFRPHA
jgi:glycosyltransferase involved in cell wall biosynthesis